MLLHMRSVAEQGQTPRISGELDVSDILRDLTDIASHGLLQYNLEARSETGTEDVVVEGQLSIELELVCARCLNHAKHEVDIPFQEIFTYGSDETEVDEEEDVHIHIVSTDKIDLKPYMEENLLVEIPYVPLCSEQCKGLCPVCGQNRNERDCGCNLDRIDPRLAGLADFFES